METAPDAVFAWSAEEPARAVADWAGIAEDVRKAYFELIGLADKDHYRVVAELSDDELNVQISTLNISERKLTLAVAGKLRLFNRACRVAAGAQPRIEERRRAEEEAATRSLLAPPPPAPAPKANFVKLNQGIQQVNEGEVSLLDPAVIKAGYDRYTMKQGAPPSPE